MMMALSNTMQPLITIFESMKFLRLLIVGTCLLACNNPASQDNKESAIPPPGTRIAHAAMDANDPLNKMEFAVTVFADSAINRGVYAVEASYGYDTVLGNFTMPKGGETYPPSLRKGTDSTTYVIGFTVPNDTTFYEYYKITGRKGAIVMGYLKAYTF